MKKQYQDDTVQKKVEFENNITLEKAKMQNDLRLKLYTDIYKDFISIKNSFFSCTSVAERFIEDQVNKKGFSKAASITYCLDKYFKKMQTLEDLMFTYASNYLFIQSAEENFTVKFSELYNKVSKIKRSLARFYKEHSGSLDVSSADFTKNFDVVRKEFFEPFNDLIALFSQYDVDFVKNHFDFLYPNKTPVIHYDVFL